MDATSRRYANALFQATPPGDLDAVLGDLESIGAALQDPTAQLAITDPEIPRSVRRKACAKLSDGLQPMVQRFVQVLLERRRERILLTVAPAFRALVLEARGEVEGVVETAKPLGPAAVEALATKAGAKIGKKVLLQVVEKPELIGGVRMRIGNTLFDSSVATAIDQLEQRLMAAPIP